MFVAMNQLYPKLVARTFEFTSELSKLIQLDSKTAKDDNNNNIDRLKDPITENQRELLEIQ